MAENSVGISIQGNLIDRPPCDVYGQEGINAPLKIDFGELAIQRIDGKRYRQSSILYLSCGSTLGNNIELQLSYSGSAATFDDKALASDRNGIGIRLYQSANSAVVAPNDVQNITMSSNGSAQIALYAVPVKDPNPEISITEGKFSATATIALNYP